MDSRFGFLDLENPQYTFFPDFIGPGRAGGGGGTWGGPGNGPGGGRRMMAGRGSCKGTLTQGS